MTKEEVTSKIDSIIDFSECAKFIDTPVKRYSSGMFVKLAFAVAAHLDAEIMIMDEVLAVGDMCFQKKCITKMRALAAEEDRTVLYVSHNMNTVRDLCDRCIVLDHGKIVFDGDVEEGIKIYLGSANENFRALEYVGNEHKHYADRNDLCLKFVRYDGKENNIFYDDEQIQLELMWENKADIENLCLRVEVSDYRRYPVTAFVIENFYSGKKGETHTAKLKIDVADTIHAMFFTAEKTMLPPLKHSKLLTV